MFIFQMLQVFGYVNIQNRSSMSGFPSGIHSHGLSWFEVLAQCQFSIAWPRHTLVHVFPCIRKSGCACACFSSSSFSTVCGFTLRGRKLLLPRSPFISSVLLRFGRSASLQWHPWVCFLVLPRLLVFCLRFRLYAVWTRPLSRSNLELLVPQLR